MFNYCSYVYGFIVPKIQLCNGGVRKPKALGHVINHGDFSSRFPMDG